MPSTEPELSPVTRVHVAVGVILSASEEILISLRSASSHQGGLWEFPGGKVEQDESVQQALRRELCEELGIEVVRCRPLIEILHDYTDKAVLLDVWWVDEFTGTPVGKEGQSTRWVTAKDLDKFSFPAANKPIIKAVRGGLMAAQGV